MDPLTELSVHADIHAARIMENDPIVHPCIKNSPCKRRGSAQRIGATSTKQADHGNRACGADGYLWVIAR
jgi:hypothetical protein